MKDPIVICILCPPPTPTTLTRSPCPNKSPTSEVTVAVGIVKSARDEEQRSEAKSQSESKTFSWIKQANHRQLWLGLHITPRQGRETAGYMWIPKTETESTHIRITQSVMHWLCPTRWDRTHAAPRRPPCLFWLSWPQLSMQTPFLPVPNVFMLTLPAGIGLQRSDWKRFHCFQREEKSSLWLLLACKAEFVSAFQSAT